MIASGYTLDLYCDAKGHVGRSTGESRDAEFNDESKKRCWKRARTLGWKLNEKTGRAICPVCVDRIAGKKAARGQAEFIADIRNGPKARKRERARQRKATRGGIAAFATRAGGA